MRHKLIKQSQDGTPNKEFQQASVNELTMNSLWESILWPIDHKNLIKFFEIQ